MSTITITPTVDLTSTPPRVQLDVDDSGTPANFTATIMRIDPDGVQRKVFTADGQPLTLVTSGSNRIGSTFDYRVPYGAPVSYTTVEDPGTVSAEVTVDETRVWLIHPSVPGRSIPVTVAGLSGRKRRVQRGVHYPMGGKYPIVQTDGQRKAPEYTLTVRTVTLDELTALDNLLDDTSVLLLNVPASKGWGIGAEYVSVGDTDEDRLYAYAVEQRRHWALPIVVVDAPVGGTQADRTYADLFDYASYDALKAAYSTYNALQAGP